MCGIWQEPLKCRNVIRIFNYTFHREGEVSIKCLSAVYRFDSCNGNLTSCRTETSLCFCFCRSWLWKTASEILFGNKDSSATWPVLHQALTRWVHCHSQLVFLPECISHTLCFAQFPCVVVVKSEQWEKKTLNENAENNNNNNNNNFWRITKTFSCCVSS